MRTRNPRRLHVTAVAPEPSFPSKEKTAVKSTPALFHTGFGFPRDEPLPALHPPCPGLCSRFRQVLPCPFHLSMCLGMLAFHCTARSQAPNHRTYERKTDEKKKKKKRKPEHVLQPAFSAPTVTARAPRGALTRSTASWPVMRRPRARSTLAPRASEAMLSRFSRDGS